MHVSVPIPFSNERQVGKFDTISTLGNVYAVLCRMLSLVRNIISVGGGSIHNIIQHPASLLVEVYDSLACAILSFVIQLFFFNVLA